ncbi:hypothetical protein W97_03452 [Coniosporium apollinis CBS 100218]|uniref:Zinc finger C3HC4 RING-type domain-containing protein n=1 Tax=Coniosporium apollinis (strain CBS 100218) TaxID=1168221 RepID=R7YQN9_CONA1|nr:uncharacterized protein W97_03452 [Coniosporium apollinis CBS 100218]EON64222.1 hypothetical protein W97_03452 [Coniosporium apollinis CBS 100218]
MASTTTISNLVTSTVGTINSWFLSRRIPFGASCSICQSWRAMPVALACNHVVCSHCLLGYIMDSLYEWIDYESVAVGDSKILGCPLQTCRRAMCEMAILGDGTMAVAGLPAPRQLIPLYHETPNAPLVQHQHASSPGMEMEEDSWADDERSAQPDETPGASYLARPGEQQLYTRSPSIKREALSPFPVPTVYTSIRSHSDNLEPQRGIKRSLSPTIKQEDDSARPPPARRRRHDVTMRTRMVRTA